MLTGIYAARNITGERHDVWSINTEKEYLEEGRSATLGRGERLIPKRVAVSVSERIDDKTIEVLFAKLDPVALGIAVAVVGSLGLMLATSILLLNGGEPVGPNLALLANYLPGYEVTWNGVAIGGLEAATIGFGLGYLMAWLRNQMLQAYAVFERWRSENEGRRHLLD